MDLTPQEWTVLRKLLLSKHVEFGIGCELDNDLTEDEETVLWAIIQKARDCCTS